MRLSTLFSAFGLLVRHVGRPLTGRRQDPNLPRSGPGRAELERRLNLIVSRVCELRDDARAPGRAHRLRALRLAADDLMIAALAEAGFDIRSFSVPLPEEDRTAISTFLRRDGWTPIPVMPEVGRLD